MRKTVLLFILAVLISKVLLLTVACRPTPEPTAITSPIPEGVQVGRVILDETQHNQLVQSTVFDLCAVASSVETQVGFSQSQTEGAKEELVISVSGKAAFGVYAVETELGGEIERHFANERERLLEHQEKATIKVPAGTRERFTLIWNETRRLGKVEYMQDGEPKTAEFDYRTGLELTNVTGTRLPCPTLTLPIAPTATAEPAVTPSPTPELKLPPELPNLLQVGVQIRESYGTRDKTDVQERTIKSISDTKVITQRRRGDRVYTDESPLASNYYLDSGGIAPWIPSSVYQDLLAGEEPVFNTNRRQQGVTVKLEKWLDYPAEVDGILVHLPAIEVLSSSGDKYVVLADAQNPYVLRFEGGAAGSYYLRYVEGFRTK